MGSLGTWTLWSTLCLGLGPSAALRVTMSESRVESVRRDSVLLPCSFSASSDLSRLNVIWTLAPLASPESPEQVIVFDHGRVMENPSFVGRVGFTGLPLSADIMLNHTRVSDAGTYRCMVSNPPEAADPGIGELTLSVFEPPSLPVCSWVGDTDVGGSVRLSCSVAEGAPTPRIHWEKVNQEDVLLPIDMEDGPSASVQIVNVSVQTSGSYRCSATNILGTENCYVNLAIYAAPDGPSGLLQAMLLTLSMGLLLLTLLPLILWLHRSGQDGRRRASRAEEDCYEIKYTASLMKRSFV